MRDLNDVGTAVSDETNAGGLTLSQIAPQRPSYAQRLTVWSDDEEGEGVFDSGKPPARKRASDAPNSNTHPKRSAAQALMRSQDIRIPSDRAVERGPTTKTVEISLDQNPCKRARRAVPAEDDTINDRNGKGITTFEPNRVRTKAMCEKYRVHGEVEQVCTGVMALRRKMRGHAESEAGRLEADAKARLEDVLESHTANRAKLASGGPAMEEVFEELTDLGRELKAAQDDASRLLTESLKASENVQSLIAGATEMLQSLIKKGTASFEHVKERSDALEANLEASLTAAVEDARSKAARLNQNVDKQSSIRRALAQFLG